MVKILGIGDLIVTALLLASAFSLAVPLDMLIFISVAILFKGFIFLFDIGSVLDIVASVLLILTIFVGIPSIILFTIAILMAIKAVMSLFA